MARRDRRFTARDVARLYCNNLTPARRVVAERLISRCNPGTIETEREFLSGLIGAVSEAVAAAGIVLVPEALEVLAWAVENADEGRILDQLGLIGEPTS